MSIDDVKLTSLYNRALHRALLLGTGRLERSLEDYCSDRIKFFRKPCTMSKKQSKKEVTVRNRVNLAINPDKGFAIKITPADRETVRINKMEKLRMAYQECAEVNHYVPLPLQSNVALRLNNENVLTFHGSILAAFSDNYDHLSQSFLKVAPLLDNRKNDGLQKSEATSDGAAANEPQPQQSIQASNSRPYVILDCCSSDPKCSKLSLLTVSYVFQFLYEGTLGITFANVPHLLKAASFFGLTELKNLLGQIILRYAEGNPARYMPICLHMCFDHNLSEQFKEAVVTKAIDHLPRMIETLSGRRDEEAEKQRNHKCPLILSLYEVHGDAVIRLLAKDQRKCHLKASIPIEDSVNWQILKFEFVINWLRRNPRHSPTYVRGLINASCDFDRIDLNTAFYCLDKAAIAGGLKFFIRNRIIKALCSKVRRKTVVGSFFSAVSGGGSRRSQGSSKMPISKETTELREKMVKTFKGQQMQPPGATITLPVGSTEDNSTEERPLPNVEDLKMVQSSPTVEHFRTILSGKMASKGNDLKCSLLRPTPPLRALFDRYENRILEEFPNLLNKRGRTLFVSRIEQPNFAVQVTEAIKRYAKVKYEKEDAVETTAATKTEAAGTAAPYRYLHRGGGSKSVDAIVHPPVKNDKHFFYTPLLEIYGRRKNILTADGGGATQSTDKAVRYGSTKLPEEKTTHSISSDDRAPAQAAKPDILKGRPSLFIYSYCEMVGEPGQRIKTTKYILKRILNSRKNNLMAES